MLEYLQSNSRMVFAITLGVSDTNWLYCPGCIVYNVDISVERALSHTSDHTSR